MSVAAGEKGVASPRDRTEPYSGYHLREVPEPDPELARVGAGTPMGEFFRRFWLPVCLSEQLTDLPHAIRILGEDLVAFRDKSGNVGVLHRHCSHRGTSLEYGIVSERGLRCCYHGWLFDADGSILETPGEPPDSKLKDSLRHGAYPASEFEGLIFAYLGPPEEKPEFPVYDTYVEPDNRMVPYALRFPCNWLQVHDNVMDPVHTAFLHSQFAEIQLSEGYALMPVLDFHEVPGGMVSIVGRRQGNVMWMRLHHTILPNFSQVAALWENGYDVKPFTRVSITRWNVPVDDTHCWLFGWRHFNDAVDPEGLGDDTQVGLDSMDFYGQTGKRPYEEMQGNPGDWEVINSQRTIAVHAREHLATTDTGVAMLRRLLREAVRADDPVDRAGIVGADRGEPIPTYTYDTFLPLPPAADRDDATLMREVGRQVTDIVVEADRVPAGDRRAYIESRLKNIT